MQPIRYSIPFRTVRGSSPFFRFGKSCRKHLREIIALLSACAMAVSSPLASAASVAAPIGVVLFSAGAQISQVDAASGTSLYAGDILSTGASGSLRVRFGKSQVMLGAHSTAKVDRDDTGVAMILQLGTIRFSAAGDPLSIRALDGVIVRPIQNSAAGQLLLIGPAEFQIAATKGSLEVEIDGEKRIVAESTAYDVKLQPLSFDLDTQHAGKRKRKALWIIIPIILISTALGLTLSALSESKF